METATATPAMLPRPTVPETAAVSAWKWVTSPGASLSSYLPRTTSKASLILRAWTRPNQAGEDQAGDHEPGDDERKVGVTDRDGVEDDVAERGGDRVEEITDGVVDVVG